MKIRMNFDFNVLYFAILTNLYIQSHSFKRNYYGLQIVKAIQPFLTFRVKTDLPDL